MRNKLTEDKEHGGYMIPAGVVNALILGIFATIFTVGGYMIVWGLNDASFKAQVLTELGYLKARVVEIGEDQDEHDNRHDTTR